jgi:hypothetical protein
VEGILRQAADVEEVDRRVQEYEQGLYFKMLIYASSIFFNATENILSMAQKLGWSWVGSAKLTE